MSGCRNDSAKTSSFPLCPDHPAGPSLLRHRQTKGPGSARLHLNRRATPRLHLIENCCPRAGPEKSALPFFQPSGKNWEKPSRKHASGFPAPAPTPLTTRVRAQSASLACPRARKKTIKFLGKRIAPGSFETISRPARAKIRSGERGNTILAPRRHESARCPPTKTRAAHAFPRSLAPRSLARTAPAPPLHSSLPSEYY